jgi:hypothetical protein
MQHSVVGSHDRTRKFRGLFPVVPTIFHEDGHLDLQGQLRCVDFMIQAGSNGLCILANFSEQFVLADEERETLTRAILRHVAGRVPVIVTTTHFSTEICATRSRQAQDLGASMVMVMPPYHGATMRVSQTGIARPKPSRGPGRFVWYNLNNGVVTASWFAFARQMAAILGFGLLSILSISPRIRLDSGEMMEKGERVDSRESQ